MISEYRPKWRYNVITMDEYGNFRHDDGCSMRGRPETLSLLHVVEYLSEDYREFVAQIDENHFLVRSRLKDDWEK